MPACFTTIKCVISKNTMFIINTANFAGYFLIFSGHEAYNQGNTFLTNTVVKSYHH
jgi:hypothetical protein